MDNSNLYYRSLTKKDILLISALGPAIMGDLLALPWGYGIGALLQEGEDLSVVGVVIGTVSEDAVCIEWMSVASDMQYKEIGHELLIRVFDLAISMDKERVEAAIHSRYLKNPLTGGCNKYFKERLFEEKTTVGEDIYTDLGEISKGILIKPGQSMKEAEYISKVPRAKRKELIDRLESVCRPSGSQDQEVFDRNMDKDISVVIQKDDSIMGALIIYHVGALLAPRFIYLDNYELLNPLVYMALTAAVKKYGKDQKILITQRSETGIEVCKKVFGSGESMNIMTAYVKDYNDLH